MNKLIVISKETCRPCSLLHNYLDSKEVQFEELMFDNETILKYKLWSAPTTILVDENDKEIRRVIGFKQDEIDELVEQLTTRLSINNVEIKVKYFDSEMPKLEQTEKGDWVDLYVRSAYVCKNEERDIKTALKGKLTQLWDADNRIYYSAGKTVIVRLGVAIELPHDKKANIYPRSSLFASWGLLLTNGVGCIDNVYKGDNDEWLGVFYATRDGFIEKYNRLVQFDVVDRNKLKITEVDLFGNGDRSGYGSSGK